MRLHRTPSPVQRRPRLRTAAGGAAAALLLLTACGSDGEQPEAAPAATGEADATAESPSPGTAGTDSAAAGASDEAVTVEQPAGGQTELTLDPALLDTLQTLRIEVAPVPPATRTGTTFSFPVQGGTVTLDPQPDGGDPFTGTLQHEGGLELSALGRSAQFTDLVVDADSGQVTADVNGQRIPLLGLDEQAADVARQAGELVVSGEAATLSSEAAQALSDRLGVPLPQLPDVQFGQLQVTLPDPR